MVGKEKSCSFKSAHSFTHNNCAKTQPILSKDTHQKFSRRLTTPFPNHRKTCDNEHKDSLPKCARHQPIFRSFRHKNTDRKFTPVSRRLTIAASFPTGHDGNVSFKREKTQPNTSIFNSFKYKSTQQKFTPASRRLTFPFPNRSSQKSCKNCDIACVNTNEHNNMHEKYTPATKRLTIPFTTRNDYQKTFSNPKNCEISSITNNDHYKDRMNYFHSEITPSSRRSTIQLPTRFRESANPDTRMFHQKIAPNSKRLSIPFPARLSQNQTSSSADKYEIACITNDKMSANLFRDYQHKPSYQTDRPIYESMDKIPPVTEISQPRNYWNRNRFQRTWPHIHRDFTDGITHQNDEVSSGATNTGPNFEGIDWNNSSLRTKKKRWKIYDNKNTQKSNTNNRYIRWFSSKWQRKPAPDPNEIDKRRRSFPDDLSGYIKWISTRGRHKVNFQWLESEKKRGFFGDFQGIRSNLVKQPASLGDGGKCSRECLNIDPKDTGSCHLHCPSQCTDNFLAKHNLSDNEFCYQSGLKDNGKFPSS